MTPVTFCSSCGSPPTPARPAVTWVLSVDGDRRRLTCTACTRAELTLIEARLS